MTSINTVLSKQYNLSEKLPAAATVVDSTTGQSWSGSALIEKITERSSQLSALGACSNSNVIISNENAFELLLDILSIWHMNSTAVPISTSYTSGEISRLIKALNPSLVLVDGQQILVPGAEKQSRANNPPKDYIQLILVTSGTSGEPKLVVVSEAALSQRLMLNIQHIGVPTLRNTLVLLPLHFGHGLIGNTLTALFAGGTVFLGVKTDMQGMSKLGEIIDDLRITFLSSVPSIWRMVLKLSKPPQTSCLQRVHIGSEPLSSELWQSTGQWCGEAETVNMYGMTETANWISGASGSDSDYVAGSVGHPWGGEFALRTEQGEHITPETSEQPGEILIKSPSIMTEYFGNEEETLSAFKDDWFLTGDLGEFDKKGSLRIIGRLKNQINCAGNKVSVEEIDQLLEKHPEVLEACSFAAPDEIAGEVVAAAVVLKEQSNLSIEDLQQWCRGHIRKEAVPTKMWAVASLAKTARGKLDRKAVQKTMLKLTITKQS